MENTPLLDDEYFMRIALQQANEAFDQEEVPVGAVVVTANKIIAKTHNMSKMLNDVTAHSEILSISSAAHYLGGKYLTDCTLYVTLEPCTMCAGALYWAQLGRLVFGASDPKRGYQSKGIMLHPKTLITQGILSTLCSDLLLRFFKELRT